MITIIYFSFVFVNINKKGRPQISDDLKPKQLKIYSLSFLAINFNNKETPKLTTAPSTARTTVLIISDEPMFTNTVKTVPETVPMIVPLSML